MNNDLISRNALLEVICRLYPKHPAYLSPTVDAQLFGFCNGISNALLEVDHAPAVDTEPVRRGEWAHLGGDEWCCTVCGEVIHTEGSWEKPTCKYCHECGAKMDGDVNAAD